MNLSAPKITRHTADDTTPMIAGKCFFCEIHWSTKITINSAVIAKSTPFNSNGKTELKRLPVTQPVIQ